MLGWEDVHCQTSRFEIDKQSCPRALQPHVNTHSLDPSSAWGCPKQAATRAGSSQDNRSYIKIQNNPCKQNVKHVFYKYIRLGRCSLPNFKIRYRQAIMSEGFATPCEHTLPGPLLRFGAAPNRLPPELAPLQESLNMMAYRKISRNNFVARAGCRWSASKLKGSPARWTINPPLGAPKRLPPPELTPAQNSDMVRTQHLRSRIWSSHPCWKFCTNTVGLFHHHLKASAGERKVGKGEGKIHIVYCACL